MTTESILSNHFGGQHTIGGAAILTAVFWLMPVGATADQRAATTSVGRVAAVSLSDLDLSTPEGRRVTRDRLHIMAKRVCTDRGGSREASSQPAYAACVDSTVANALRQIDALRRSDRTVRNSVTRAANVSLSDLDLSTLEGSRIARDRLEAIARRLCGELARRAEFSYPPDSAACVHDALAGALAQADVLAAARNTVTARRSAP